MTKKAQIEWVIVVLLFLAVALVVIGVVYKIKTATEKSAEKGICKLSVEKLALGRNIPIVGSQLAGAKVDCARETVIFKKAESQDEKNIKLARATFNCADNFWEGKKDFTETNWLSTSTHCAICAKIQFEKGAIFDADAYKKWLDKTSISGSQTYGSYFAGLEQIYTESNKIGVNFNVNPDIMIDTGKEYYLFYEAKQYTTKITPAIGQISKFRLESTDEALKNCENLLN